MASFSQGFLSNLGRPAMTQSMFDLGSTLGKLPQQRRDKQQRAANAEELQNVDRKSPDYFRTIAKQLEASGQAEKAAIMESKAQELEQVQASRQGAEDVDASKTMYNLKQLQSVVDSEASSESRRSEAANLIKAIQSAKSSEPFADAIASVTAQSGAYDPDRFSISGNNVWDNLEQKFIQPSEAAEFLSLKDLKGVADSESIVKYLKSGDKNDLLPIKESPEGGEDVVSAVSSIDNVLDTVDKALGLEPDYWKPGYDLVKMMPLPTDAKTMSTYVTTLQSNLAFDRLQKMRDNSKTGGALGQVSNIELDLLKGSVAALDPGSANFRDQLLVVRKQYENFKNALLGKAPVGERYYEDEDGAVYYYDGDTWRDVMEIKTSRSSR